ncbi:CYTH domain-containing protein [Zunongwangia sp.]|uniref:CYTH domain-containing protein n=1 Tax=Zunongwangia sp. TaxID=1965325 RepID=UPI003AA8469B
MIEIERKFLVKNEDFKKQSHAFTRIKQGFLNSHPERTVRVRITNNTGFLTIKGKNNESGLTRFEWETEIPSNEAEELIKRCESEIIDKTRYLVRFDDHVFEVDEFYGDNEGLVVAEIELLQEDERFEKPEWLGVEVTGHPEYYNSQLSKNPFKNWKK